MQKLLLIKLGGSLITDKDRPLHARGIVIRKLGEEIAVSLKKYKGKIILGHGSGSFGHEVASKYQTQKGIINKQSLKGLSFVSDTAIALNRIVAANFLKAGLPIVSFSPGSFIIASRNNPQKAFLEPISEALSLGVIPLVYGDVVFDKVQGVNITSTEKILTVLASGLSKKYKIEKIIYGGITDGVYDKEGKTIPKITPKNYSKVRAAVGVSGSKDITGGMIHKVKEALKAAKKVKAPILIINASKPGLLRRALVGKSVPGTVVSA